MKPTQAILDRIKSVGNLFDVPIVMAVSQCKQESSFNPKAKSSCGAIGLFQVMPGTGKWIDHELDTEAELYDVDNNIYVGIRYDRYLFGKLSDIPGTEERWKMTLASYNCGLGYIRKAIALAKMDEKNDLFTQWDVIADYLADPRCEVAGKRPYHEQTTTYIAKIWGYMVEIESKGGFDAIPVGS